MRLTRRYTFAEGLAIGFVFFVVVILFVPFGDGSHRHHHTQCLSNMKQVGTGFLLYLADNEGQFPTDDPTKRPIEGAPPMPTDLNVIRPFAPFWMTAIQPYLKDGGYFRCSEDPSRYPTKPENLNSVFEYSSSFTLNGWAEYQLNISDVASPKDWVFLGDRNNLSRPPDKSWSFYFWTWQGTIPLVWPPTSSPDPTSQAAKDIDITRHRGSSHWISGDGSARSKRLPWLWKAGKENAFWPSR